MLKRIIFSLIALSAIPTLCMDENKGEKSIDSKPINLTHSAVIKISTSLQKEVAEIGNITKKTTIRDIKDVLKDSEAIPVDQQSLYAKTPYFFGFFNTISKQPLSNETKVWQAMKDHQTSQFLLYLTLRQPRMPNAEQQ